MCALPAGPCRSLSCGSAAVLPRGGHAGSACYGYQLGIADEDHGGHVAAETSWNPWLSPSHHNSAKAHPVGLVPPAVTCCASPATYGPSPATCGPSLVSHQPVRYHHRVADPPGRPARWHIEPAIAGSPTHRAGWI